MFCKTRWASHLLGMMLSCIIIISQVFSVYATNTVDSLEQESSDLQDELDGMQERLDATSAEIDRIAAHIVEVKEELAKAKGKEKAQYRSMKLRMVYIYESGNVGMLHTLLSADSLADFLNRAEYISMVNEYDRNALYELQQTRDMIAAKETALAADQETLLALQKQLEDQVADTSGKLEDCKRRIQKAKAQATEPVTPIEPEKPQSPSPKPDDDNTVSDISYTVTEEELQEFAALLECEAGTTHEQGILAVASVVVNRMKHHRYPDTLHGVMFQSGQFPPVQGSKFRGILERGVNSGCLNIAKRALAGENNVGDCLSFRAASSGHAGTVIGSNVFF